MGVRNCADIGENLQKIMSRLLANDKLVKLLYYSESDPLSKDNLTDEQKKSLIWNKLIKFVPRLDPNEVSNSVIAITVFQGDKNKDNSEFKDVDIVISVYTSFDTWIIKDSNLRPFAILGQLQESLSGKSINGLGKLEGGDFSLTKLTDEISQYDQFWSLTSYD